MGVEGEVKCGAEEREEAVEVGVKVPVRRWPFAWAVEKCQYLVGKVGMCMRGERVYLDGSWDEGLLRREACLPSRCSSPRLCCLLKEASRKASLCCSE